VIHVLLYGSECIVTNNGEHILKGKVTSTRADLLDRVGDFHEMKYTIEVTGYPPGARTSHERLETLRCARCDHKYDDHLGVGLMGKCAHAYFAFVSTDESWAFDAALASLNNE
jgi:hypothetical protein